MMPFEARAFMAQARHVPATWRLRIVLPARRVS